MAISPFQFSSPLLLNAQFQIFREPHQDDDVAIHLHRNVSHPKDGSRRAVVDLTVQLNKREDKLRENACFFAEVTMQSVFTWSAEVEESRVEQLLESNAVALLISYIRPVLSQLTAASPLQAYNLPFINLHEVFSGIKAQEE